MKENSIFHLISTVNWFNLSTWKFRKHRFFDMRMLLHKRTDTIVPLNKICIWQFLSKAVLLQVIEYFSLQPGICRFVSMRIVELQTLLSTKAFEMFTEEFFLKCVYVYKYFLQFSSLKYPVWWTGFSP